MAEDQAAGMPPTAGNTILALGAGEAGPEPAAECWPPFLLLAQSVAKEYLDQDVQTLVAAVEQTLEAAAGEGVELAPKDFTLFDDVRIELRVHPKAGGDPQGNVGSTGKEAEDRRPELAPAGGGRPEGHGRASGRASGPEGEGAVRAP